MAIHEDLIYFLKNGRFENINFGITREQLIEIIGEPEFILPEKSKMPTLFEYGNVEFYFEDETKDARLQSIQIDYPVSYSKKGSLIFKSYRWNINLTLDKAIDFLNRQKIKFEEKTYPINVDFWRLLVTEGGVQIHFTNQRDVNVWELHKFGRTFELNQRKSRTKQVSFEIEEKFYEQLREKAEKTRISIASLCKEIIEKHLEINI
jgi:hypothetical protein